MKTSYKVGLRSIHGGRSSRKGHLQFVLLKALIESIMQEFIMHPVVAILKSQRHYTRFNIGSTGQALCNYVDERQYLMCLLKTPVQQILSSDANGYH